MPIALIYHHQERPRIEEFCDPLEAAGYSFVYAPIGFQVGSQEWREAVTADLADAHAVILFLTELSICDETVAWRVKVALPTKKPFIPLMLDQELDQGSWILPHELRDFQWGTAYDTRAVLHWHEHLKSWLPKPDRRLVVFLCHGSEDKQAVRDLYQRLQDDGIRPWLDEKNLQPGDEWEPEIKRAVRDSDIVLVCISKSSACKTGFIQKEIRTALDAADEKPEQTRYIIPGKLEECAVPNRLQKWHWVNLYEQDGYEKLSHALELRAHELGIKW